MSRIQRRVPFHVLRQQCQSRWSLSCPLSATFSCVQRILLVVLFVLNVMRCVLAPSNLRRRKNSSCNFVRMTSCKKKGTISSTNRYLVLTYVPILKSRVLYEWCWIPCVIMIIYKHDVIPTWFRSEGTIFASFLLHALKDICMYRSFRTIKNIYFTIIYFMTLKGQSIG